MSTTTKHAQNFPDLRVQSLYQDAQKPHRFKLLEPVIICLSNGYCLAIPAGYITDFASVPRLLRGVVSTVGRHNLAVLIHDYLYDNQHTVTGGNDWKADRRFADLEMLFWLRKTGVSEIKARVMFWAVRLGGRSWWLK